jgi:hypothetical protein
LAVDRLLVVLLVVLVLGRVRFGCSAVGFRLGCISDGVGDWA